MLVNGYILSMLVHIHIYIYVYIRCIYEIYTKQKYDTFISYLHLAKKNWRTPSSRRRR